MTRFSARLFGLVLFFAAMIGGPALAQSGAIETHMTPSMTLPQTAWVKAEILGDTPVEQSAREKVDALLRQRGYTPEKFSPYAVRIEIRGAGVQPVQVAIPQYTNSPRRLSLWNSATGADTVTVSLTLYHQSSGQVIWQAEGTCRGLDAASIPGSMIFPLMEQLGRTTTTSLSCARAS